MGRTGRRRIAGAGRFGVSRRYIYQNLAPKERADRCEAHRGHVAAGAAAQGGRRRGWAAALGGAGGPDGGVPLRSPKSHGSTRCATVKRIKGSKRAESRRRHVIARIRAHLRRRCRVEIGRVRGRDREGLAWGNSGRRGSAPARPGQSSGVAGQPAYGGAEVLARRSGWWRRARDRDGGAGGDGM